MNKEKLTELLKQKTILIPLLCFQNYKELQLTLEEFVFLMYLKDHGQKFIFDPKQMSLDLGVEMFDVLNLISSLTDKKMLTVETFKNDKQIVEEEIDLSNFYEKYTMLLIGKATQDNGKEVDSSIFEAIEKEFGRTLSPSEFEFIKAWLSSFDEGVILEAVKEAILNGVSSIRYIDKILYEWDKKKIKSVEDVERFLHSRRQNVKESIEVFDYDWLNDTSN